MINIAIAEDHKVLAESLKQLIDNIEGFRVVLMVHDGKTLLDKLDNQKVDVLLLDLDMPIIDGRKALSSIRKRGLDLNVIILSMYNTEHHIRKYLQAGANAYLKKESDMELLVQAIKEVVEKGYFYNDAFSEKTAQEAKISNESLYKCVYGDPLSQVELRVTKLLCEGFTNVEIAKQLIRSHRTIENHRYNIMKKLGVSNAMELMEKAIVLGIHEMKL